MKRKRYMLCVVAHAQRLANPIRGLCYLETYCVQVKRGRVLNDAPPTIRQPKPDVVSIDAKFGFAKSAFAAGLPVALAAAKQNDVVSWVVVYAHTCTSLGYFIH